MRLVSWNVASLRARLPRTLELLADVKPDVLCLQETKCAPEQLPREALEEVGYKIHDYSAGPWNGVAIATPVGHDLVEGESGLPGEADPSQARWVEATVNGLQVVSVYVVNGKTPEHPDYASKLQFFEAMKNRIKVLSQNGPIAVLGDMNVCPTDLDCWDPAKFEGATHTSEPERSAWRSLLQGADLRDAHIEANGESEASYTWWDYRMGSFHRGWGLRIDMALLDPQTASRIESVSVARDYRKGKKPSDHAPLVVDLSGE